MYTYTYTYTHTETYKTAVKCSERLLSRQNAPFCETVPRDAFNAVCGLFLPDFLQMSGRGECPAALYVIAHNQSYEQLAAYIFHDNIQESHLTHKFKPLRSFAGAFLIGFMEPPI